MFFVVTKISVFRNEMYTSWRKTFVSYYCMEESEEPQVVKHMSRTHTKKHNPFVFGKISF